jgi:hypothetical protein
VVLTLPLSPKAAGAASASASAAQFHAAPGGGPLRRTHSVAHGGAAPFAPRAPTPKPNRTPENRFGDEDAYTQNFNVVFRKCYRSWREDTQDTRRAAGVEMATSLSSSATTTSTSTATATAPTSPSKRGSPAAGVEGISLM